MGHTCFRMMFGDWDWDPIERVRRSYAYFWFMLFILIIVIILLNMLLAIVIDSYLKVKHRASDAITLPRQCNEMWRRYWATRKKQRMRLNELYDLFLEEGQKLGYSEKDLLDPEKKTEPVTSQSLKQKGVLDNQVERTIA